MVRIGDVDVANGGSVQPSAVLNSSLNTLIDVQSRAGVMDEVEKLVERVEIDVTKAPTITPSVSVSTLPGESPSMSG